MVNKKFDKVREIPEVQKVICEKVSEHRVGG
jgi:hypothetical protein